METTGLLWLLAVLPIALLTATVLSGRVSTSTSALVAATMAVGLGPLAFGAGPQLLAVGVGKGLWLGTWILAVIWPALLLFGVASAVGLERIGRVFEQLLPRRAERLLLLAWLLPSFLQGVAGFGTPIAVAAPLLHAAGWSPSRSVAYPLIGYHWSVTFGSMGSSFYMASLVGGFDAAGEGELALRASALLALAALVAPVLVLAVDGGVQRLREGRRMLVVVGIPMAATLVLVASAVPAVASLAAGAVGFAMALVLSLRDRDARAADTGRLSSSLVLLSPYVVLLATALPVFVIPPARAWVTTAVVVAPSFPATGTTLGHANEAVAGFTPLALLGHPGSYILLACGVGHLLYRRAGMWPEEPPRVLRKWAGSLWSASTSVLLLAVLAMVMADTGMVEVIATGIAAVTGGAYPLLAPLVGAFGSFMTGSTTSSNALFTSLQVGIADSIGVSPAVLVAAQTVGGNIGNSIAPVVGLIGVTAVGEEADLTDVLRLLVVPAGVLLAVVAVITGLASMPWAA